MAVSTLFVTTASTETFNGTTIGCHLLLPSGYNFVANERQDASYCIDVQLWLGGTTCLIQPHLFYPLCMRVSSCQGSP